MRPVSAVLAAAALSFFASFGGSPALANGPAIHSTFSVVGDVFDCDGGTYTIISGLVKEVIHEGTSESGNENFTGTNTPVKVVAVDEDGNEYRIVGAVWFGGTFNAQNGGFQATFTGKLQIVGPGGTADSVNVVFHISPNGQLVDFDFGSCDF